jgi:hypothetical protein
LLAAHRVRSLALAEESIDAGREGSMRRVREVLCLGFCGVFKHVSAAYGTGGLDRALFIKPSGEWIDAQRLNPSGDSFRWTRAKSSQKG